MQPTLRSREDSVYYRLTVDACGEVTESIVSNAGHWRAGDPRT